MDTALGAKNASPPPAAEAPRYWAFLSYSHRDEATAKALQRRLETYRLPRRLVGRHTPLGRVPVRARPVFRDRDELHAGTDLKAHVRSALAASRWMIVLCSPDAAGSPWVEREIVEFKKLHGEDRVLACIVDGEPFASRMAGRAHEECFPRALRYALDEQGQPNGPELEPIAADMRAHADGPQRAALKLLAGMLGLGLDELVRRDLQRRIRWLGGIASASVVGMVVLAVLAGLAVQARNDARREREQAEGLIEFMLGDLRKKLEPVGRLEVLDAVGEKAMAYYAGAQEAGSMDARALGHRSRALHLIGEIHDLRGQFAEAQAVFERAATTTAQLLEREPNNPQRLFDHAQSAFWVGYAAWKRGDGTLAERHFKNYLQLSQRLSAQEPGKADWRAEVAFAHVNLGTVYASMNRATEALGELSAAESLLKALVVESPALAQELAQTYGWKSFAYRQLGDHPSALSEQKHKLALLRELDPSGKDAQVQRSIVTTLQHCSTLEVDLGRMDEAANTGSQAVQLGDRLAIEDPSNMFMLAEACLARLQAAETRWWLNQRDLASQLLQSAQQCNATLRQADPVEERYSILFTGLSLALKARLRPNDAETRDELTSFLSSTPSQPGIRTSDHASRAMVVASVALGLGDALPPARSTQAAAAWRRAELELQPLSSGNDVAALTSLAQAQLRLGNHAGAQRLAARVRATPFRHPLYLDLETRLKTARSGPPPTEERKSP